MTVWRVTVTQTRTAEVYAQGDSREEAGDSVRSSLWALDWADEEVVVDVALGAWHGPQPVGVLGADGPVRPRFLMREVSCSHNGCTEPVAYFISDEEVVAFFCATHRLPDVPLDGSFPAADRRSQPLSMLDRHGTHRRKTLHRPGRSA